MRRQTGCTSSAGISSDRADKTEVMIIATAMAVLSAAEKVDHSFSTCPKQHCVTLAKTGGESSNTELLTCLEMTRDVRAFRSTAATPSEAATTRALSSPSTSTVQPPPAKSASPQPSANEPPKMEVNSMLKALKQAQADARTARDSEEMAKRKLADAETDLKRAKEEAGRAT
jgi:hypothetical protein